MFPKRTVKKKNKRTLFSYGWFKCAIGLEYKHNLTLISFYTVHGIGLRGKQFEAPSGYYIVILRSPYSRYAAIVISTFHRKSLPLFLISLFIIFLWKISLYIEGNHRAEFHCYVVFASISSRVTLWEESMHAELLIADFKLSYFQNYLRNSIPSITFLKSSKRKLAQ